jgi:hypothetical protein
MRILVYNSLFTPFSFTGTKAAKRKLFEDQIGRVVDEVRRTLNTATAPTTWRLNSYSNLNSKKVWAKLCHLCGGHI